MKFLVPMLLALAVSNPASALTVGIFQESLSGECQGTDSARGALDLVAENLSLDMSFDKPSGSCQMVSSLLLSGTQAPAIDLQLAATARNVSASMVSTGTGLAQIDYQFVVYGPTDTLVNINVAAAVSISGSENGNDGLTGSWGVGQIIGLPGYGGIDTCSYWGSAPGTCQLGPQGGSEVILNYVTAVQANQVFDIRMIGRGSATSRGGYLVNKRGEVQVVVDPTFTFENPADAGLYTMEFSPNLTAVPVPSTAPLLATGLLAAAGRFRRRRAA